MASACFSSDAAETTMHRICADLWQSSAEERGDRVTEDLLVGCAANGHHWDDQGEVGTISAIAHHCQRWLHLHHDGTLVSAAAVQRQPGALRT